MPRRSLIVIALLFTITVALTVSCGNLGGQMATPTDPVNPPAPPVRLGFSAWPGWFPWQVAEQAGIFEANQAVVNLTWFDGYLESINTLKAGQIDANSQTLGDTVNSLAGGADQVIVLVNDNSTGNDQVIGAEGINSVSDLRGKKVAAEEGTVDHFLLLKGLQKAGMTAADIEFVPLETGQAAAAFVAGQVDAVAVFAPFTTQALKRPNSKTLFSSKDFPGVISDHLVFSRQYVESHPEQVQAVVNAWFATLDHIQKNSTQAQEIMAKRAGVSLAEYRQYNDGTRIFTIADNLKAFQPGNDMASLSYSADQFGDFLVQVGLAQQKPDTSRLFDDRFVKAYAAS